MHRSQDVKLFILNNLREHPNDIAHFTAGSFGISRQAAWKHVKTLINSGDIKSSGTGRKSVYKLVPKVELRHSYQIAEGLQEDKIWREDYRPLLEKYSIRKNVLDICQHGFTEIFNNAIEHSEGTQITVWFTLYHDLISIFIGDDGVGIFAKIRRDYDLDDEMHAILELSKGRLTTDPESHSGEGIFFTSRMFDQFKIWSHELNLVHLDPEDDYFWEDRQDYNEGTVIILSINPESDRTTKSVFDKFTVDPDKSFERTVVPVFLAQYGDENLVSRSQAKRLMARVDVFKEVVLDFNRVKMIGPAFADEVFRVYKNAHPNMRISYINENADVRKMIERVRADV